LFHPAVSALTLAFCVGLIFFFHSLGAIIIAFDLKRYLILEWGNLLAIGIIGFIASVILLINPHLTSIAIVIFLGISLIIGGAISIYSSLKLRKLNRIQEKI